MMMIAAAHSSGGVVYGAVLIVFGILHFIFREFYARRSRAFHDARQATAPAATQRFYRSHSESWYLRSQYWVSALFVVGGVLYIAFSA